MVRISLVLVLLVSTAHARPDPQWAGSSYESQQWFQDLMRPDDPLHSCCGAADAFQADDYETEGVNYVAIITEGRGIWPNGTRIVVPNAKINTEKPNPTGHGYIFLKSGTKEVWCYSPPSGL